MVEFANRLTDRGHSVTFYVPADQPLTCRWMPLRAGVRPDARGLRRRAGRHLLRPREPVAPDRPLLVGPPARVLRDAREAGQPRRLVRAGRPPAGQQRLDRRPDRGGHRPPTGRGARRASTGTPSTPRTGRSGIASSAPATRCGRGRGRPPSRRPGRMLGVAGRGSLGEGPRAGGPGAGVRRGRGVRGRQLVRGVRAAGARGDGIRGPARHHRQRRQPRVRARRRDRAGRPAEGCLGDGRRAASACSTTRLWPPGCRRTRSSSSTREFDWERPHRRPGRGARRRGGRPVTGPHRAAAATAPEPRAVDRHAPVERDGPHQADGRVGPHEHRRALRADHRGQRLGVGGGQLRVQRGRPGDREPGEPWVRHGHEPGPRDGQGRLRRVLQQRHRDAAGLGGDAARDGPATPEGRHRRPGGHRRPATANTVRSEPGDDGPGPAPVLLTARARSST